MRHSVIDDMLDEDPSESFLREDKLILNYTRHLSMGRPRTAHRTDNDNNPERVTRMVPFNGGCSTTSGRTPVTMPRLAANDNTPDAESELAGRAVNEYAMRVAA